MPLRFAIIGTGFWARYQLPAWRELPGIECVAVCDKDPAKAAAFAREHSVARSYSDAGEMLRNEKPDFVDIITDVSTHAQFVELAAQHRVPVICQKPMGRDLAESERMARVCSDAKVFFAIHENWRWQRPIRELKAALATGEIGAPFRARIDYVNSFPVFDNQPFLKELDQFILTDMGTHILDVARFLFGEAESVYARIHRVRGDIKGEDAATVVLEMRGGATVTCNLSYSSKVEQDRFPEAFIFVEGDRGAAELAPDYWVRVTTAEGTRARRCPPPFYAWADPRYALVQSSIVDCHRDILNALRNGAQPETSAEDNLKTLRLVYAAYESAAKKQAVKI